MAQEVTDEGPVDGPSDSGAHAFSVEGQLEQGSSLEQSKYDNEARRYGLTKIRSGILSHLGEGSADDQADSAKSLEEIEDELSQIGGTFDDSDAISPENDPVNDR